MIDRPASSGLRAGFAGIALSVTMLTATFAWSEESTTEKRLFEAVKYLASDELEGRGVGTDGLEKASQYIADEFAKLGLKTQVFGDSPFQPFEMLTTATRGPREDNTLRFVGPGDDPSVHELRLESDFHTLAIGGSAKVRAPVVFGGYGITAADRDYNDYADLDVKGKVVIVIRKTPQQGQADGKFNDSQFHAFFTTKVSNAHSHGAIAVVMVNDAFGVKKTEADARQQREEKLDELAKVRTEFRAKTDPSDEDQQKHDQQVKQLLSAIRKAEEQLESGDFDKVPTLLEAGINDGHKKLPVFFAKRASIDPIVKAGLGVDLATLEQQIDEGPQPHSGELKDWTVACQSQVNFKYDRAKNVAAVLEGEGPLADEIVVVGAHYDHVGMGGRGSGSLAPWTRAVHNGADDNASGTAMLLEVARAMASREQKPARRILFMAFAGEERGLLGSDHYVKNAALPLDQTVTMINMDMVGRLKDNKLSVTGTGTAKEFDALLDELNKRYEFDMSKEPSGYGPSDHQSFYTSNVPAMHFFTGTHSDYHRPSDDYDKINVEGMTRLASLVTDTVARIADGETRPTYQKTKRGQRSAGSRPYLGTVPDRDREVEGYALMDVAKDGPAEKAGMKAGDVIVKFGDSKITSFADIDAALRKFKPDDEVKLVIQRDGEEVELTVKLAKPQR